jgi:cytochrome P450
MNTPDRPATAAGAAPFATIPGPAPRWWGLPLLRAMRRDYLGFCASLHHTHGDMARFSIARERGVEVFHPDLLREALVDQADALIRWERGPEVFAELTGQNVLVTEGSTWQRQRRMLMPAFTPKKVAGYAALMADATRAGLDAAVPAGQAAAEVDMALLFSHLAMDVILRTLFGAAAGSDTTATARAVRDISDIAFAEMFWPLTLPDWLPLPGKATKRQALRQLKGLIAGHLARPQAPVNSDQGHTLLAMLRALRDEDTGQGLAEQEVFDQCMVSFTAGHETTATALLWWSALLARHPEAATRATQEVDAVLQGREPGPADLAALPWLGATLKEAMRLYPPVAALMTRRTTRAITIGGHALPARALVRVTPWVIHRDARFFPEPQAFRPKRFMPGAEPPPRGAYLPFGIGPRVCLGQHFAVLEMTLIAAMLLQRYRIEPTQAPMPAARLNVTLRPSVPVRLGLHRRADRLNSGAEEPFPTA